MALCLSSQESRASKVSCSGEARGEVVQHGISARTLERASDTCFASHDSWCEYRTVPACSRASVCQPPQHDASGVLLLNFRSSVSKVSVDLLLHLNAELILQ